MKVLTAGLFACVLLLGGLLLMEKADDVLNGPVPSDVQRDSLGKRFVRALANWMIDKGMRDAPPQQSFDPPHRMAIYAPPTSELLLHDGDRINHAEGW
ncbi:hypothetical protein LOC68_09800 [Blastopirellula sp. JC732]|uniref:Uncharacterized protein n=1 Tax=Blastopirellula sediminis TaxID=2894196 RepID=A0A9X1SGH3_9BACT|nr:hypothetical protein [Blastopirellula sediminis]MCC9608532.1 hypothetical protein [Blastopirellula sediminis]MCC9628691.1 hypothetical protein [Blastopirellula sediminis]